MNSRMETRYLQKLNRNKEYYKKSNNRVTSNYPRDRSSRIFLQFLPSAQLKPLFTSGTTGAVSDSSEEARVSRLSWTASKDSLRVFYHSYVVFFISFLFTFLYFHFSLVNFSTSRRALLLFPKLPLLCPS